MRQAHPAAALARHRREHREGRDGARHRQHDAGAPGAPAQRLLDRTGFSDPGKIREPILFGEGHF